MKKVISVLICILMIFSSISFTAFAENDIKVVIDGDELNLDVSPVIINGRTMIPLRAIFEYFGANVEWNADTRGIYAYLGSVNVSMHVGRESAIINDKKVTLDSPPVIADGRTLVPVRVVAEAFYANVGWDADTKTVIITTPYPKKDTKPYKEFDKYNFSTSKSDFENFRFSIDKNELIISGKFQNPRLNSILLDINGIQKIQNSGKDGMINLIVNLDTMKINGTAPVMMYHNIPGADNYSSYINKTIVIVRDNSEYYFQKPEVYDENIKRSSEWTTPVAFVNFEVDEAIKNESDKICQGTDNPYEKIKALHKWMCENIYYDYDYFYGKSDKLYYSDKEVFEARKTICGGYTNLLASLVIAQGIPCRKVRGFALGLGYGTKEWTEEIIKSNEDNHAWIQAYIDDRWVTIDCTWDSGNKFRDGKMEYKGMRNYLHFDMSDEFLASDHRFMSVEK